MMQLTKARGNTTKSDRIVPGSSIGSEPVLISETGRPQDSLGTKWSSQKDLAPPEGDDQPSTGAVSVV